MKQFNPIEIGPNASRLAPENIDLCLRYFQHRLEMRDFRERLLSHESNKPFAAAFPRAMTVDEFYAHNLPSPFRFERHTPRCI